MSYPFPEIDHERIYPKTFLKDVSVYVSFPSDTEPQNYNESIKHYFSSEFNVSEKSELEIDKIDSPTGLKIASSDEYVIFTFFRSAILLKVKFPAYRSFKDISVFFTKLLNFIKIFHVSELISVRITKYNELQFNCQKDSFPIKEIMGHIFSEPLIREVDPDVPNLSKHPRLERVVNFNDSDPDTKVNITYGYVRNDINPQSGALTLKTSVENKHMMDPNNFESKLVNFNHLVDRVFHWCVTKEILDQMSN